jgi:hypothetical protein
LEEFAMPDERSDPAAVVEVPPGVVAPATLPSGWVPSPSGPPVRVVAFTRPKLFDDFPEPARPVTRSVLIGAVVAGVVAALAVPWTTPGIGWLVTGLVVAVVTVVGVRSLGRPTFGPSRVAWAVAALLLLAAVGVLAAPWLGVLLVVAAFGCGALALTDGRSLRKMVAGVCMVPLASVWALFWAGRGAPDRDSGDVRRAGLGRVVAAILVSVVLLIVFVALFAGADPVFARVVSTVTPTLNGGTVFRWIFSVVVFVPGTLGACFLLASPRPSTVDSSPERSWRRVEWALPAGTLVAVFAAFVAVQFTVLFGGADHVLTTENLTFAQYARTGFWQLLTVTVLTLLIMAAVARKAHRSTPTDRLWLRGLLGALAVLSLVVVASALARMWTYEQAYGFSRLRVLVSVCELWLGLVFLLVLAAGIRLSAPARWLPQAVVGTGVAALLALAALNPDQFIADRNVDRYLRSGKVDLDYLSTLSVDAVPALDRLPEPERSCVLSQIMADAPSFATDGLRGWTLDRYLADLVLDDRPLRTVSCPTPRPANID